VKVRQVCRAHAAQKVKALRGQVLIWRYCKSTYMWKDPPLVLDKTQRLKKVTFYLSEDERKELELLRTYWRKRLTDACAILVKHGMEQMKKGRG